MNSTLWKTSLLMAAVLWLTSDLWAQASYDLRSPDNSIEVRIRTAKSIRYDVLLKGRALLQECTLSLDVDHKKMGLEMEGGYAVVFRAYNEGVAYRFETSLAQEQVKIYGEEMNLTFPSNSVVYYPQEDSFFSHNERRYTPQHLREIAPEFIASLPAVVDVGEGAKVAIAESDVEEYPGLWLRGTGGNGLSATFPPYPLREKLQGDRDFRVVESADYVAATIGKRTFPWRVMGIVERDGDLLTNQLVWLLEKPSQVQGTSWIKPGKVAWDWWNYNNVYGVDFKAGVNTQTYKYYIDFAAKYGIPYIILDEGW